ncbi:maleylpyruvate isomerase family mycothiol-dependent enzyme [Planosporangium thailandense]|uniref:Maleylpyruvate isomerase family mycothiol-dependent enzyme n=1 Tax=Planosporangium thailandense TaxID=765197 RepID=A0ABX0Y521_9ACTN|nr:maleylpyruvate isomerase family mycothiol-dependent enzyme [Planosporangium thailandense]NJC73517.1 maleylpyruvate isomerase family mycothiol-dependent enzyme [Planosporangium thailandense]
MRAHDYLTRLRSDLERFEACLARNLDTPVEHCGDWTLYDLADHLGRGNLWAAVAVTEKRNDRSAPVAPRDPAELVAWFRGTATTLLTALDAEPSAAAWTFAPPRTVGFWQRRRCLETLVHRWDAEHALGIPGDLDPQLSADGVAEVIDTFVPRQVKRGLLSAPARAVRLRATDTGAEWVLGPGDPVATISAGASALLLLLWGRLRADDPTLTWDGDREAAQAMLDSPLVP